MENKYVVIGQAEIDGEGILIGRPADGGTAFAIETYGIEGSHGIIAINEELFNSLAHFVLEELLQRHRKCLENQSSQIG